MDKSNIFRKLHEQDKPLLLGNAWNVHSALSFQQQGYEAIGTSSAAIASSLGYEDGEQMPFNDLLRIVGNIQAKIEIPLTVDIEAGYSRDTDEIARHIMVLQDLGIAGINIEDSITTNQRSIVDAHEFGELIRFIKSKIDASGIHTFINVRTDHYIMGLEDPLSSTIQRIKIYTDCGADGIFVPAIVQEDHISQVVSSTPLPINVMCMPTLPDFDKLADLGVKRISVGPFMYNAMMMKLNKTIQEIKVNNNFNVIFD